MYETATTLFTLERNDGEDDVSVETGCMAVRNHKLFHQQFVAHIYLHSKTNVDEILATLNLY